MVWQPFSGGVMGQVQELIERAKAKTRKPEEVAEQKPLQEGVKTAASSEDKENRGPNVEKKGS